VRGLRAVALAGELRAHGPDPDERCGPVFESLADLFADFDELLRRPLDLRRRDHDLYHGQVLGKRATARMLFPAFGLWAVVGSSGVRSWLLLGLLQGADSFSELEKLQRELLAGDFL
jgi:hypothetical protein